MRERVSLINNQDLTATILVNLMSFFCSAPQVLANENVATFKEDLTMDLVSFLESGLPVFCLSLPAEDSVHCGLVLIRIPFRRSV